MSKRFMAAILAVLLVFSLAGCGKGGASSSGGVDFQKNMHQSASSSLRLVCETRDGLYLQIDAYVYYTDLL